MIKNKNNQQYLNAIKVIYYNGEIFNINSLNNANNANKIDFADINVINAKLFIVYNVSP